MMEKALGKMAETQAGGKSPEKVPGLDGMEGGLRTEGRPHLERVPSDSAEFVRPDRFDVPDWKDILTGQESGPKLEGFLPRSNGSWEGDEGDSIWKPDPDYVPLKSNPEGKTWEEIEDKYGMDGVKFKDGEPDFSEIAEATVEIDDFTENRFENFAQADGKLAEQWNAEGRDGRTDWTARDVAAYRKENNLTWHERSDMKTMDLVPSEVHNNIPHAGGISARKQG